jgi:hypothetical protein
MRKIAYAAGAIALAAVIVLTWSRSAPIGSQAQTAAVAGGAGHAGKPAEASHISPSELMKARKTLPVEYWADPF